MLDFHIIIQSARQPWGITFDHVYEQLAQIPGFFVEPDGSFFRASRPEEPKWQVEGNLYDQGLNLAHVEMKGCCPEVQLDELLRPLGWPKVELVFQMVREGTCLTETEFRVAVRRTE